MCLSAPQTCFSTVLGPTNWLGTFWILLMRPQDFMWGPTCRMSPVSWSGLTLCGNSNAIEISKTKRAAFRGKNACSNPNFDFQCQQTCLLPLTCQNLGAAAVNDFISVFKCFCLTMEARRVLCQRRCLRIYLFIYLFIYFVFFGGGGGVFFLLFFPFFSRLVYRFCRFSFPGGFGTWGRDFVAIAQLFAPFMVLGGFGYCPAFEGLFMLQSCANCDLPAPWFLLSSPVTSWILISDNKNCPSMLQTQPGPSQPLATPDPHQS